VVPEKDSPLPARSDLAAVLPPEAVPSWIVAVPELPTLGPGKIDRDRLPDPPMERRASENPFVAPATAEETFVAAAFAGALGLSDPAAVGALDDFFALGGTSILSLDVLLGLERSLGRPVDAAVFLEDPTPRGIARRLSARRGVLEPLADGQGDPVFFIPGHGGGEGPDLLQLARLARQAAIPEPVLAFRLPPDLPETREALLDRWTEALLERQSAGPWKLVAFCAGGSVGFSLAARLSRRGEVRLILHDALFPNPARRVRRFLRRLREPWGDDLVARLLHHLREAARQGLTRAFGYLRARAHSAAVGVQRMSTSTVQQMVGRQDAYLRLALAERPAPWTGETHLIVTPNREGQDLPRHWRTVSPCLAVRHTGPDAEGGTAAAFRDLLGAAFSGR
jgi:thioesterase domain-containing protein